ncbi:hypothetical protein OH687_28470 [Burkholderia anthina]|nr:hypothetical protein OH687_28470 [Burkholderia anthina]
MRSCEGTRCANRAGVVGERRQCVEACREAPMVHDHYPVKRPSMAIAWPVTMHAAGPGGGNVSARTRHPTNRNGRTRSARCL